MASVMEHIIPSLADESADGVQSLLLLLGAVWWRSISHAVFESVASESLDRKKHPSLAVPAGSDTLRIVDLSDPVRDRASSSRKLHGSSRWTIAIPIGFQHTQI